MDTINFFCDQCGTPLVTASAPCTLCGASDDPPTHQASRTKGLLRRHGLVLGLIPWFAFLIYVGYAKSPYFKTAALVNDQRISLSELNREVEDLSRAAERQGAVLTDAVKRQIQATALDGLINRRLIESATREQGLEPGEDEIAKYIQGYRAQASLQDDEAFREFVSAQYGSMERFERVFRTNYLFRALINASGISETLDPIERRRQVNAWLVGLQRASAVRVLAGVPSAFASQSGCSSGTCTSANGRSNCGGSGSGCSTGPRQASPELEKAAGDLALQKARGEFGGAENLTTKVLDYGCHVEVQVFRKDEMVKSYTYQNGQIQDG